MPKAKFLEIVGNASTTAVLDGKNLGRDVNACAYTMPDGQIKLVLESNSKPVPYVAAIYMTEESYATFKEEDVKPLFVRGIELFGATTAWSEQGLKK